MAYKLGIVEVNGQVKLSDDEYTVDLVVHIVTDKDLVPGFSKILTVKHSNKQNGYEVDEQQEQEVQEYLKLINK